MVHNHTVILRHSSKSSIKQMIMIEVFDKIDVREFFMFLLRISIIAVVSQHNIEVPQNLEGKR